MLVQSVGKRDVFKTTQQPTLYPSLLKQIRHLQSHCQHLIVVSNEIFSDGICYDLSTTQYLSDLGYPHRELCRTANEIYEVVCGIPIPIGKEEVI